MVLGQILQYCSQNKQCCFRCVTTKASETQIRNTEFTVTDSDSRFQVSIIEFADKGGNISPKHDECVTSNSESESSPRREDTNGKYNIKVTVTKDSQESIYKIRFPDKNCHRVEITVEQNSLYVPRARRTSERSVRDNTNNDYIDSEHIGFSSTDSESLSQKSILPSKIICGNKCIKEMQNINLKELIEEITNGEKDHLQQILESFKDFISSESNLQLLLKGLFMNAKINGEKIIAEIEISAGEAGKIDLILRFPDGKGIILELKFCEKVKDVLDNQNEADKQLEKYNKGNLTYIVNLEKSNLISIVFCKGNAECMIKVQDLQISESDSGIGSSLGENLSISSDQDIIPETLLNDMCSTPLPSPGIKRKVLFP